jgi:DNA helicase-2/ATP-dependent DNA helicase PcrA
MLFGMLVHQTIEDIHRTAIRGESQLITNDNIEAWFVANYETLSRSERSYLAEPQKQVALKQVKRYAEKNGADWSKIQETEVGIELVKPDYILSGVVDLIKGDGDTVEVVDFKAEKKPNLELDKEVLEKYRRQLNIYAHLIEEKTKQKVSKMHIYYTGEDSGVPLITYPYSKTAIDGTIASVDAVVQKIMAKDYSTKSNSAKLCSNCDFRFYCKK